MWSLMLLCMLPLAIGQFTPGSNVYDRVHDFIFEYHRSVDLLVIRNSTHCFIVDTHHSLDTQLDHKDTRESLEDELYLQIKEGKGESVGSLQELRNDYQDTQAVYECMRRQVYKLTYTPSSS